MNLPFASMFKSSQNQPCFLLLRKHILFSYFARNVHFFNFLFSAKKYKSKPKNEAIYFFSLRLPQAAAKRKQSSALLFVASFIPFLALPSNGAHFYVKIELKRKKFGLTMAKGGIKTESLVLQDIQRKGEKKMGPSLVKVPLFFQ